MLKLRVEAPRQRRFLLCVLLPLILPCLALKSPTAPIVSDWAFFASWDKYPGHAVTDENGPGEDYVLKQDLNKHH
jgi:hypothetical protein